MYKYEPELSTNIEISRQNKKIIFSVLTKKRCVKNRSPEQLPPNYLRSLFKEMTGKTILEYSVELRMEKAAELLKNKSLRVKEVSAAVGYGNVSYFGTLFQKKYGVTPNAYRKMV